MKQESKRRGSQRQPRLVLLDEEVAKSIEDVVAYRHDEIENFVGYEPLNSDTYDPVFLDKVRVEDWLNEQWFNVGSQSDFLIDRFSAHPNLVAMARIAVALAMGYLLGITLKH